MSGSWSRAVEKKPPAGSAKSARIAVAQRLRLAQEPDRGPRLVQVDERVGQVRVVLQVGREVGRPRAVGAEQAAVGRAQLRRRKSAARTAAAR